ncbi:MAG: hypothetical protein AAGB46_01340 [Verrucomicrobiota bacterium]
MAIPAKFRSHLILTVAFSLVLSGCRTISPTSEPKLLPLPKPLPDGHQDGDSQVRFPGSIGEMHLQAITDYESSTPGLGVGLSYRGRDTKLEIFVYSNGANLVPNGIEPPIVQEAFANAIGDVEEAVDENRYADYRLLSYRIKDLGNHLFLKAEFSYSEQLAEKRSLLYVTGFNTRIVKIRITTQVDKESSLRERIFDIEEDISFLFLRAQRQGLVGITQAQAIAIQKSMLLINLADGLQAAEALTIAQLEIINRKLAGKWNVLKATLADAQPIDGRIEILIPERGRAMAQERAYLSVFIDAQGRTEIANNRK